MSSIGGAIGVAMFLVVEEVLVTSKGGPSAITGAVGSIVKVLDHLADPSLPLIPDLTTPKSVSSPPPTKPALPGQPPTANPLQVGPPGSTGPVRDYNPSQVAPGGKA